jgi:hypothetical protein
MTRHRVQVLSGRRSEKIVLVSVEDNWIGWDDRTSEGFYAIPFVCPRLPDPSAPTDGPSHLPRHTVV